MNSGTVLQVTVNVEKGSGYFHLGQVEPKVLKASYIARSKAVLVSCWFVSHASSLGSERKGNWSLHVPERGGRNGGCVCVCVCVRACV